VGMHACLWLYVQGGRSGGLVEVRFLPHESPHLWYEHECECSRADGERAHADEDEYGDWEVLECVSEDDDDDGEEEGVVDGEPNPSALVEVLRQRSYLEGDVAANEHDEAEVSVGDIGGDAVGLDGFADRVGYHFVVGVVDDRRFDGSHGDPEDADQQLNGADG